jgi:hypothetical protein
MRGRVEHPGEADETVLKREIKTPAEREYGGAWCAVMDGMSIAGSIDENSTLLMYFILN